MVTLIYTGNLSTFNLTKPQVVNFPRFIPITVNPVLQRYLPNTDFEIYDNSKSYPKPDNIQPILITLPRDNNIFYTVKSVEKIRKYYPISPIHAITDEKYFKLFNHIENVEMQTAFKVRPGQYYREYSCKIPRDSVSFGGGATLVHTNEFNYLQHLGLQYQDVHNVPTLYKIDRQNSFITIMDGTTIGNTWQGLKNLLLKQHWNLPIGSIETEDFDQIYSILEKTAFLICTGETDYAILAAYMGIPVFIFTPNIQSVLIHQLNHFNNIKQFQSTYSPFVQNIELNRIYTKLYDFVSNITKGSEPVIEQVNVRDKIVIPETPKRGKRGRTRYSISKNNA